MGDVLLFSVSFCSNHSCAAAVYINHMRMPCITVINLLNMFYGAAGTLCLCTLVHSAEGSWEYRHALLVFARHDF